NTASFASCCRRGWGMWKWWGGWKRVWFARRFERRRTGFPTCPDIRSTVGQVGKPVLHYGLQFSRFVDRYDGHFVCVRKPQHFGFVEKDGFVGLDGQDAAAGFVESFQGADADGGDVEAHVLLWLGDFHQCKTADVAELAGAADAFVG